MNDAMWTEGPLDPELPAGELHLWRANLAPGALPVPSLLAYLDDDEQARARRFRFQEHRWRFVAAHALVRLVLARYANDRPERLRFGVSASGKPHLAGGDSQIRFNLSHSDRYALVAVTDGSEIGVDLERVTARPDRDGIARRFFAPIEQAALAALPDGERLEGFFACWTRKEACLKAAGLGIASGLDRIVVSVDPRLPARVLAQPEGASGPLWLADVPFGEHFRAAVAVVGGSGGRIRCWEYGEEEIGGRR
jgi:4'-phosphopantetheinyl transferase